MCKAIGDWVPDTGRNAPNSLAYQDYVAGKPGTDFYVKARKLNKVKFDGCKDQAVGPMLLDAKAKQASLLNQDLAQIAALNVYFKLANSSED